MVASCATSRPNLVLGMKLAGPCPLPEPPFPPSNVHRSSLRPSLPLLGLLVLPVACLGYPGPDADTGGASLGEEARATLEGIVSDEEGAPVAGALLTTIPHGFEATAGDDGAYRIDRLPPGDHQVVAAAPGWLPATSSTVTLAAGQVAALDLTLAPAPSGGALTVRLLGPDDQPLAGAIVRTSAGVEGTTDADGALTLSGVAGEGLQLTVGESASTWPYQLDPVDISDAGGLQLAYQVSGRPPEGATWQGNVWCTSCHSDVAAFHADTAHAAAASSRLPDELEERFLAAEVVALGEAEATLSLVGGSGVVALRDATGAVLVLTVEGLIGDGEGRAVPYALDGEHRWPLPLAWIATDPDRAAGYPDGTGRFVAFEAERWFDDAGRFSSRDPADSAEAACLPCHVTGADLTLREDGGVDMVATNGSGGWNDAGVQCEACHGPGSAHATTTDEAQRAFTITSPELLQRDRAEDVCGQCHSRTVAEGTGLPYPLSSAGRFQPGLSLADFAAVDEQRWADGSSRAGRQQVQDVAGSPHGTGTAGTPGPGMICLDCHGPHGVGRDGVSWPHMGVLDPDGGDLCLSCHLDRTFGGDAALVPPHAAHARYQPESDHQTGRCATCHMPATAATVAWSEQSGAGDVASHGFGVVSPQVTLDAFDAASATTLPVGSFPPHSCAECHDYGLWYWEGGVWDSVFPGPAGDPTARETQVEFLDAYVEKFE